MDEKLNLLENWRQSARESYVSTGVIRKQMKQKPGPPKEKKTQKNKGKTSQDNEGIVNHFMYLCD